MDSQLSLGKKINKFGQKAKIYKKMKMPMKSEKETRFMSGHDHGYHGSKIGLINKLKIGMKQVQT